MYINSVTKRFLTSVIVIVVASIPGVSSAGEQPDETGNVVGSAVEAPSMPEISSAVTPSEVVISQDVDQGDGKRGTLPPSETAP